MASTTNYSLYSIPAAWATALSAHWVAILLSTKPDFPKGKFDNCSPRGFLLEICAKPKKTKDEKTYIRAEAANANGFENLPLFAASIVAANAAKVDPAVCNKLAGLYVGLRILYNVVYIRGTNQIAGALRSSTYMASIGTIFALFVKASQKLNSV